MFAHFNLLGPRYETLGAGAFFRLDSGKINEGRGGRWSETAGDSAVLAYWVFVRVDALIP